MHQKWTALLAVALLAGCSHNLAYRDFSGDLAPRPEEDEDAAKMVMDDGSVVYTKDRLEIRIRPMTEQELNRQFPSETQRGSNPYTFGNTTWFRTNEVPKRFTVFRVTVKNYQYPKVILPQVGVSIASDNGRNYYALSYKQLYTYFRSFSPGGKAGISTLGGSNPGQRSGNEYRTWTDRLDILNRSMFTHDLVFSGQESEGYLVFEPLHADVNNITVHLEDIAVRFDFRGVPTETIDVDARFHRETGKLYPDGRRELTYSLQ